MNEAAKKAKAEYQRNYCAKYREKINKQQRERRRADPERYKKYQETYWNKKAAEGMGGGVAG